MGEKTRPPDLGGGVQDMEWMLAWISARWGDVRDSCVPYGDSDIYAFLHSCLCQGRSPAQRALVRAAGLGILIHVRR